MEQIKSVFVAKRNKQEIIDVFYRLDDLARKILFNGLTRNSSHMGAFEDMFERSKMNEGFSNLKDFFNSYDIDYIFERRYGNISNSDLIANMEVFINLLYENKGKFYGGDHSSIIFIKACESYLYENGYKIELDKKDDLYKVIQSDTLIEITDIVSDEITSDFLDFYSFRNTNDLVVKRKVLFELANKLITIESQIEIKFSKNFKSELFKYANKFNIRHPNRQDGKDCILDIKNLTDNELLDWYNFIYPLFLNVYINVSKLKKVDLEKKC